MLVAKKSLKKREAKTLGEVMHDGPVVAGDDRHADLEPRVYTWSA